MCVVSAMLQLRTSSAASGLIQTFPSQGRSTDQNFQIKEVENSGETHVVIRHSRLYTPKNDLETTLNYLSKDTKRICMVTSLSTALFQRVEMKISSFLVLFFFVPLTEWSLLNLRNRTRSFLDA